jgi:hypothetical protein
VTRDTDAHPRMTAAMAEGRRADSTRRRQRVLKALHDTAAAGEEITVSAIARDAGVDRTFLYRHPDLLAQIHASQAQPPTSPAGGPAVSRASLHADLLNAQHRAARLAVRVQHLEKRLSDMLGERAWQESGLGAADDVDQLKQCVAFLEQNVVDLRLQLDERDQDLAAARTANRELMSRLNAPANTR